MARAKASLQGLHLHFDALSGIAGDMTVAALVDAGVPADVVADAVAAMKVPGLETRFERRKRGAFVGRGFVVSWPEPRRAAKRRRDPAGQADHHHHHYGAPDHHHHHHHDGAPDHHHHHDDDDHHHHHDGAPDQHHHHEPAGAHPHEHRSYADIRKLLARAKLAAGVRARAEDIFARIAKVEAALHGVPVDRISFHEVGAYDSIADVVGAAAALAWLAPASVSATPPVVGTGHVRTEHGLVPVPAPATLALLDGVPFVAEGRGELTTPTGAAILAATATSFGPPPPLVPRASGYGAGTRELADRPNVLRVLIGDPVGRALPPSEPSVLVFEANLDDMTSQLVPPLLEALFAAGAVDAWATSIVMKKGRPALTVSALAPPAARSAIEQAFFDHSTTLGVRCHAASRTVLERSESSVTTPWGRVAVKVAARDGAVLGATAEFDACRALATRAGVPTRKVWAAATAAANQLAQSSAGAERKGRRKGSV